MPLVRLFRHLLAVGLALAATAVFTVPAQAAANRSAVGEGSTAQFLCPSGVTVPATISFSAQKSKGVVSGSYNILGVGVTKFGSIRGGTITQNSFSLTGFTTTEICSGVVLSVPVNATLTGECGTGVIIHYEDALGERGDFLGNVACA
jgi:hypothetical protein